ncbi:hypothetical protein [Nocardioides sp. NPDC127503]|uniref:DUF6932 family protein n=1 Tax=Nocardioides sp. NPDC127503 TaxID=3154516 RepID=UPI00332D7A99
MLPDLTSAGVLPPGIHKASWDELVQAFGTNERRRMLLGGLSAACLALADAGCTQLWVDGSFVTDKDRPGDYDACWDPEGVDRPLLDPVLVDYSHAGREAIKAKYLGDVLIAGVEIGSGLSFVEFFQRTRDGGTKGIVLLNPKEVP